MKTLGLDIGTTSISSVIFQEKTGVLEAKTIANGTFLSSESWERLQNPAAIWQKAFRVVSELLQRHPDVRAIGVTGQMHGILYLNADGEAASPLYTWQDGRGDLPFGETNSWAEHLSAITGHPLSTGYGMVTHFYNLHHGLVPENAVCLCTIGDYIAMKLAGLTRPRIEPTNGASLGLFHLGNRCFDPEALLRADIDGAILPKIAGQKGILHLENVNDNKKVITFEKENFENAQDEEIEDSEKTQEDSEDESYDGGSDNNYDSSYDGYDSDSSYDSDYDYS